MMTPLPSINKVYGLLQQDESQKETQTGISNFSGDSVSFHASAHTPSYNSSPYNQKVFFNLKNQNVPMTCKYCKNPGHTIDTCYRFHGFTADFKFTKKKRPAASCVQMVHSSGSNLSSTASTSTVSPS